MVKRSFLALIGLVLLVAVAAPPVQAGEGVRVNWELAGAFFNGFSQVGSENRVFLFQVAAKGSPGSATILGINQGPSDGVMTIRIIDDPDCFEGANFKQIPIAEGPPLNENSLAATFNDLSILNMAVDESRRDEAFNCLRLNESFELVRFDFVVPIKFVGGFGRFEGATGKGTIRGQSMPIMQGSGFGSEIGSITGTIILP